MTDSVERSFHLANGTQEQQQKLRARKDLVESLWIAQSQRVYREIPAYEKGKNANWYAYMIIHLLIERTTISSAQIHEVLMEQAGEHVNEYFFWKYLDEIAAFEEKTEQIGI